MAHSIFAWLLNHLDFFFQGIKACDHVGITPCLRRKIYKKVNHRNLVKKCVKGGKIFLQKGRKNIIVLPKIIGKMSAVSYGFVLTGVIEQMEAVRLNTLNAGTE